MAGIGFVLRKLSKKDDLTGIFQAYLHSAVASCGPWLFTVLALAAIMTIGSRFMAHQSLFEFRILIIYNFAFSLVMSAPIYMVVTRYLADCIYEKDVTEVPGVMLGALMLSYAFQFPVVTLFYVFVADLDMATLFATIANFMIISAIWVINVFVTALKNFKVVTQAFAIGMLIAILSCANLAEKYEVVGMLVGFTIGMSYILASLIARVLAEYPYRFKRPFAFMGHFKKYWELSVGGFFYNAAAWVDKWIMWFAPEGERLRNGLFLYPNYDTATFMAFLTIVPSMAVFVFSVETNFFERYLRFYRDIQQHANFRQIQENQRRMIRSILGSARNFLVLQGSVCAVAILMAPKIFDLFNINYMQMGIFRYGTLGALFHVFTIFFIILLSYFDNRKGSLYMQLTFFFANAIFTLITIQLGFEWYGFGYFLAAVLTFVVVAVYVGRYVIKLPYHTFISSNTSVE